MTRDDAIKIFNTVLCLGKCDCSKDEIEECLKMAIKALQEHQYYKDLAESYEKTINKLTKVIAEQQQKTGHWIEHKHGEIEHIECSECRCWFLRKDLIRNSYCPNCGSRNHWEWELKMQEVKK